EDNSFDIIITTDSFHEMNPNIQSNVLSEMMRVSNLIIFIEPDEVSVTNELFKVFDPNENHSLRIKNSMDLAFTTMKNNNYKLIEKSFYDDKTTFSNKKEMCETLLDWWSDIKIPANDSEKKQMIDEIERILIEFDMLDKLEVFETIHYYVFERK
ncbi:MAG: class I SAM-dependent methyltransferase, partial [Bacilli bacterium]|nr:class I SAM-dependent methyltransferase [Bacilli bacterium]